jgi:mannose-6-phosphate isomerase-like protein (cupin superfamily)
MSSRHAYFVTGTKAVFVANDSAGRRAFEADEQHVPARMQRPVRTNTSETVYFVIEGTFEFMVAGATGYVTAGNFVRVPAAVPHAYRNVDNRTGRLFSRTIPPGEAPEPAKLLIEVSAA